MAANTFESLGAAGNSLGAPPGCEGMGKKNSFRGTSEPRTHREKGLLSQHHNPQAGKAIKHTRDDTELVHQDKSDRHDKTVIRSHELAGFQEITLGRSVWMRMNNHPTLLRGVLQLCLEAKGWQGNKHQKKKSLVLSLTDKMQPLPWSLEMSPLRISECSRILGGCWFCDMT